ncbi:hypothetical protein QTG54_008929 [Skeletonema marinoi]|uniref:Uncharacterized protein n=1 Tax=Skeletonema marinoi TaxID=267567 RepID=A0AAD9DCF6_9STRA|nr:hypothetical protein QTG54_008929 [Skeletonema marinoi]
MLPYKIRKPVYSGASKHFLPEKPAAIRTDGDGTDAEQLEQLARDDPRLIGGNLQKAILLDLIGLRECFLERENGSASNVVVGTVAASSSPSHIHNAMLLPVGTSFERFKATFRDRRFGAIHTRTAPRNIDRGEYAQLLYSCCFYLLEESVENDGVDKFNLPRSIFSIFALYTLHQTNPLPMSPPTRQSTPRSKYGHLQEDALQEAWSVLPISREEQNLHRKSYKSPVRIDRKNYLLLIRLSDVCKAILAHSDGSSRHCGIAQDASYIIDKMIFTDNFFSYCEYHGPCGLEGLAGNPHFYKEHFVKQKKKPKKGKSKKNGASTFLPASSQLTQERLDKMKNDEHLTAILNLSDLSNAINTHKLNLQNVTTQLQKSRQPGGDLQPKQRELVENTLSGVHSQHAYFGMAAELNGESAPEASRAGNGSDTANSTQAKESDRNDLLPLIFSESFSSELRGNICEALADLNDDVALIRNSVMEEIRARNTTKEKVVIDTGTLIVVGAQGDKSGQSLNDILAFFDVQSETSDALEVNDGIDMEDVMSMATGAGKNALETLLMMAENKMDAGQLDDDSASNDESIAVGDTAMDDNSVATGSGMRALQNLLSQTTGGSTKHPTKRPAKAAKTKTVPSSDRPKRQKTKRATKKMNLEDEISVATGAGKNALSSLLTMAKTSVDSDELDDGSLSCHESIGEGDDNSTTGNATKQQAKRKKSPKKPKNSKSAPLASRQKRQKTKRDTKQSLQRDEEDDEVSMNNASTATGLSGKDDVSVASTTAAGKDALAALLSQVKNVEEV